MAKHQITTFPTYLLIFCAFWCSFVPVESIQVNTLGNEKPRIRSIINYRDVNWCITGQDEPELHLWPFNQFVPIIRRTHRFKHDDKNYRYDIRFYEVQTTQKDNGMNGVLYKTVHVIFKAEAKRNSSLGIKEKWEPFPLEGLLVQANHNPGSVGLPTGKFFEPQSDELTCMDCLSHTWARFIPCRKKTNIAIEHPTLMAFHHLQRTYGTPLPPPDKEPSTVGRQHEIHANFRWYSPLCTETRRLEFLVLAVRSFQNHEYDIFRKGPYEVIVRDQKYKSDMYPSPYFSLYTPESLCHIRTSVDILTEHPRKFHAFEMSSKFGCCTMNEENPKSSDTNDQIIAKNPGKTFSFSCKHLRNAKERVPLKILIGKESWQCYFPFPTKPCDTTTIERHDLSYTACDPCATMPSTTTKPPETTVHSIYKRDTHGGVMIMTNFCLQPIVIFIARFYKETFNMQTYKGVKMWYWMHLVGGMISSTMIYFGYFSGKDSQRSFEHVVIGNVYILTLVFCYLTSWGRHKNSLINTCAEFFHGSLGYVTISLALACVYVLKNDVLGFTSKMLVFSMIMTQVLFMIIMTFHVCMLDIKFGMRPRRRHFPTVEARFDEVEVPKSKFRIILLVVFSFITFCLSFSSTFFD